MLVIARRECSRDRAKLASGEGAMSGRPSTARVFVRLSAAAVAARPPNRRRLVGADPPFRAPRRRRDDIEFGLLAAPFVAAPVRNTANRADFFASQTLETAAATSARLIFTGQAQTQRLDRRAIQVAGLQSDPRHLQLQQRRLCRCRDLSVVFGGQYSACRSRTAAFNSSVAGLQSRRAGRHRDGAALLPVSGLRQFARLQSEQFERRL